MQLIFFLAKTEQISKHGVFPTKKISARNSQKPDIVFIGVLIRFFTYTLFRIDQQWSSM